MNKENIWQLLGIDETKNQQLIKEAYRKQLVQTNPEDDAQGFIALRDAYEEAIRLSTEPEADEVQTTEKDDIDLWMDDVDSVYRDILKRLDITLWEELLKNPVCTGLDTYLEARERFLAYLINNYYLPENVWILLDHHFYFIKDKEVLIQTFPRDFIEYAIRQIENYVLINLELFTFNGDGSVDDYIRSYYNIKNLLDQGNPENLPEAFRKIDETGIYNPYMDVEKIRYFIEIDNKDELPSLINNLSAYLGDSYIAYYVARGHWAIGQYNEAAAIWNSLCEKYPTHYGAWVGLIEYYIYSEQYKEANERIIDLLKTYSGDERLENLLTEANEHLIKIYEEECKEDPHNLKVKEELAWCYYQNSYLDECIQLLNEFPDETTKEIWFLKIHGYVYAKKNEFKKSLEYNFKWLEILEDSRERDNYRRDFCICNQLIGICYLNEMDYENAIPYFKNAISLEENLGEKLYNMERLSFALLKSGKNEDSIDVCDQIIAENEGYFPAYINRQEAYFNMKNGQSVVDDYHKAVEIFPNYIKPYLLAAKVFYFYGQYEDSLSVIQRAKEADLMSNELELYYGKNLRLAAQNREDIEAALKVLLDLRKNMDISDDNKDEYNDLGEVLYEIAKTYANLDQFKEGLEIIEEAIRLSPNNDNYPTTKAYLHMDLEMYDEAVEIIEGLIDRYPQDEYKHKSLAKCYEKTDKREEALTFYKKTLDINPENIEVIEKIETIYLDLYREKEDMKYYEMAVPYGERMLELSPDSYYYVHVGIMYERGYEFEKSLECYKKATECDPTQIWSYNNAGYVYKIMKKYEDAILSYQKAIELMEPGKSMLPYGNLATCYEILGRYEEAMDCYLELLKHWPDHISTHEDIGDLLGSMGKPQEAAKKYMDMVKAYDYSKEKAYYNIMLTYEESGSTSEAINYANKLLKMNASVSNLRKVGRFYFSMGKLDKARKFLNKAIKKIDSQKTYEYLLCCLLLAEIYFDEGSRENAARYASEALKALEDIYGSTDTYVSYKPYSAINNYQVGRISMMLGDLEKAESHFKEAVEGLPCKTCHTRACFEGYYGLGRLYEEMKEFDLAEEYYKKAMELNKSPLYKRHLKEIESKKNNVKDTLLKRLSRKF